MLIWVPGQRGIEGNAKVSILTKKVTETPFTRPEPFCCLGDQTCKHELKLKEERAKLWKQLTELAHSKKLLAGYNRERNKEFVKMSKRNLRSLTDFLLGNCQAYTYYTYFILYVLCLQWLKTELERECWKVGSKSIPHQTYPKDENIRKYNYNNRKMRSVQH